MKTGKVLELFKKSSLLRSGRLVGLSRVLVLVPAQEHRHTATDDVELGPLVLYQMATFLAEGSAGVTCRSVKAVAVLLHQLLLLPCHGTLSHLHEISLPL